MLPILDIFCEYKTKEFDCKRLYLFILANYLHD